MSIKAEYFEQVTGKSQRLLRQRQSYEVLSRALPLLISNGLEIARPMRVVSGWFDRDKSVPAWTVKSYWPESSEARLFGILTADGRYGEKLYTDNTPINVKPLSAPRMGGEIVNGMVNGREISGVPEHQHMTELVGELLARVGVEFRG